MRLVEVRNLTDRPFTVEAHMEAGSAFSFEEEDLQIPAGGSRSVRVVFRPSERGRAVGLLYLRPCRKCSMRVVELAGTAVALSGTGGGPLLQASPAALDFGTWFTGRARSARLRLENVGEAGPIWVTSLSVEGDPSFSLGQPALPLDVSEGAEVDVWFLGEVDGAREGTLVVRTTWPAQPELRVPLYGEAYTTPNANSSPSPKRSALASWGFRSRRGRRFDCATWAAPAADSCRRCNSAESTRRIFRWRTHRPRPGGGTGRRTLPRGGGQHGRRGGRRAAYGAARDSACSTSREKELRPATDATGRSRIAERSSNELSENLTSFSIRGHTSAIGDMHG